MNIRSSTKAWLAENQGGAAFGYLLAIGGTAFAAWSRWVLVRAFGPDVPPYSTFYPAIILSALFGGTIAGLVATAVSALTVAFLFLPPFNDIRVEHSADIAGIVIFVTINAMMSLVGGALRKATRRKDEQARELATTVQLLDLANVLVRDKDDHIIRWNTGCQRLYGFTADEALGKISHQLLATRFPEPLPAIRTKLKSTGRWTGELVHTSKDGRILTVTSEWVLHIDEEGQPFAITEVNTDLTERRAAEAARAMMAAIIADSDDAIIAKDLSGNVTSWNRAAERIFGYSAEEVLGKNIRLLIPSERQEEEDQILATIRRGEKMEHYESQRLARDGHMIEASITTSPIRDARGEIVGASTIARDVTSRKQVEQALRTSERRFRVLFDSGIVGNIFWTTDGRIIDANDKFLHMIGYTRQDLRAGQIRWANMTPAEYQPLDEYALEELRTTGVDTPYEKEFIRKDGSRIWVLIGAAMLDDKSHQGVAFVLDISQRKHAQQELARANQCLEQEVQHRTAKLRETVADLQHFSYALTHDMRAPLRAMQSFAAMLEEEEAVRANPESLDYCRRIRTAASRLDKLIQDSLDYAKVLREALPLGPVDITKLLREIIDGYPAFQRLDITIEGDSLIVMANQAGLTQCLSNVIDNAAKFVPPDVPPKIRIWSEPRDHAKVRIWIEDNGVGIPPDQREKIFGMFQRLHDERDYPGTGIGLAIVQKTIHRMGGAVGLESEPGKGTRFWLELDLAEEREPKVLSEELVNSP